MIKGRSGSHPSGRQSLLDDFIMVVVRHLRVLDDFTRGVVRKGDPLHPSGV
jgi:hypothetical protein